MIIKNYEINKINFKKIKLSYSMGKMRVLKMKQLLTYLVKITKF